LSAGRRFVGGAFRRFASQADNIPGLIRKIGKNGKPIVEVGSQSVKPLVSSKISRTPNLNGYDVPQPSQMTTQGNGVYDAGGKQYVKIADKWYESVSESGERYIKHPTRTGDKIQIQRLDNGQWEPLSKGGKGGGNRVHPDDSYTTSAPTRTDLEKRLAALPEKLRSSPFDGNVLNSNRVDLGNYLSAKGNEATFSNLIDLEVSKGNLLLADRAEIMATPDPYARAQRFLSLLEARTGNKISEFPEHLRQAIRNGDEVRAAKESIPNLIAQEKRQLADLPDQLDAQGLGLSSSSQDLSPAADILAKDSNKDTFARLLDLEVSKGNLSLVDRAEIMATPQPYDRAILFLQTLQARTGHNFKEFPEHLRQAIQKTPDATPTGLSTQQKNVLSGLPEKLRSSPFDGNVLNSNRVDLGNYLSAKGNEATFSNLIDLEVSKGNLLLADRAEIMATPDPYARAQRFLSLLEARTGNKISEFPEHLRQAIRNGDEVRAAKESIPNLIAQEKRQLADLPDQLDAQGLGLSSSSQDLSPAADILAKDSNKDTFARLLDLEVSKGNLSLVDRAEIMATPQPYDRAILFLQTLQARTGHNFKEFPEHLRQAIRNGDEVRAAKESIPNLIAQEKRQLADLPDQLDAQGLGLSSSSQDLSPAAVILAKDSNKDTFARLLDLEVSKGNLSLVDRAQIMATPQPYDRAILFLLTLQARTGHNFKEFPEHLRQAIRDTP